MGDNIPDTEMALKILIKKYSKLKLKFILFELYQVLQ